MGEAPALTALGVRSWRRRHQPVAYCLDHRVCDIIESDGGSNWRPYDLDAIGTGQHPMHQVEPKRTVDF